MTTKSIRDRNLVRTIVLGAAMLMGSVTGLAAVDQAAADVLAPRVDMGAPGGGGGGGASLPDWAQTQNERSTAMIESTFAEGGVLATGETDDVPDFAQTQNERSISMTESNNPTGVLAGGEAETTRMPGGSGQPY
jgi:hypothetical protein